MTKQTKVRVWLAAGIGALLAVVFAVVLGADGVYIPPDPS